MDASSIILGRPWLYDFDVILYGRSNSCTFIYEGQKIRIKPIEPKPKISFKKNKVQDKPKSLHLVDAKTMARDVQRKSIIFALVATDSSTEPPLDTPSEAVPILAEFSQVFPAELPDHLPPLRDIQHAIDLVPRATLPNLPHYRLNPTEHAKLKRQVDELLNKGFIKKARARVQYPPYSHKKKMAHGICVLIVGLLTR